MAVPTFMGIQCFGPTPEFIHDDLPNAEQVNHYPGVRGVERIDLGLQGTTTRVTGIFAGETAVALGAVFDSMRALKVAGGFAVLTDTSGRTWNDAVLRHVREVGTIIWAPGWGWIRRYEMEFFHLGSIPSS